MAKRAQITSAKHPSGENPPAERRWKTPTVIVAIIAATAAILVAIIQLSAPKSKPPDPTKIEQQTHGSNSPAVGGVGGNVIITQPPNLTSRQLAAIDEILATLPIASIAFNAPTSLQRGNSTVIQLLLSLRHSIEQLQTTDYSVLCVRFVFMRLSRLSPMKVLSAQGFHSLQSASNASN